MMELENANYHVIAGHLDGSLKIYNIINMSVEYQINNVFEPKDRIS